MARAVVVAGVMIPPDQTPPRPKLSRRPVVESRATVDRRLGNSVV